MFRPTYILVSILAVGFVIVLGGVKLLHNEWRAGYVTLFQPLANIHWINYYFDLTSDRIVRPFTASSEPGLPQVKLYVPESAQNALTANLPSSTKEWHRALLQYPDGNLGSVQVRHRGDNPVNWFFDKKSWRIKTRKANLLERTRIFNLIVPQRSDILGEYLGYWIGNEMGLLAPKTRLVETYINDVPNGVHLEAEQLDESYLRNSGLMPVSLYKGEQYNSERLFQIDNDLFNNPSLWRKLSVNNSSADKLNGDLGDVLELIRNAETSEFDFARLRQRATFRDWSLFSAFQTLTQYWGNNNQHNMRLLLDNWRGTLTPILRDPILVSDRKQTYLLDHSSQPLLTLYNRHSGFLFQKYRQLYDLVTRDRILKSASNHAKSIIPMLQASMSRDGNRHQILYGNPGAENNAISIDDVKGAWNNVLSGLADTEKFILENISNLPELRWHQNGRRVSITIDGVAPINNLALESDVSENRIDEEWYWDKDANGVISRDDIKLPMQRTKQGRVLGAAFMSNRINYGTKSTFGSDISSGNFAVAPTRFDIISKREMEIIRITATHAFTDRFIEGVPDENGGLTPGKWNEPVLDAQHQEGVVWKGALQIMKTKIVEQPVIISAGTQIGMAPGASLIFRSKVSIDGTLDEPVVIFPINKDKPWGVVAIQGQTSGGSQISHLRAEGGSGDVVDGIVYTGMISIHDTQNIRLTGLTVRDNRDADDMVHVVYGKDIRFDNFSFQNANQDAIDIDISEVELLNGKIAGSGNDGVDLMSSKALIKNLIIEKSSDKGISIGERSATLVISSLFKDNNIGIESKDGSKGQIVRSDLVGNQLPLNAYKKNWRYGTGGALSVENSVISGSPGDSKIGAADKWSSIRIADTTVAPRFRSSKRVAIIEKLPDVGTRRVGKPNDQRDPLDLLSEFGVTVSRNGRGRDTANPLGPAD